MPRTPADILSQAYAVTFGLDQSVTLADLVGEMQGLGVPRADIEFLRAQFAAVEHRCVVSKAKRGFLDLVIGSWPAA